MANENRWADVVIQHEVIQDVIQVQETCHENRRP